MSPADYEAAVAEGRGRTPLRNPRGTGRTCREGSPAEGVSGDYLVWRQSIEAASIRDLDLLIVTGDERTTGTGGSGTP
jgi:hypothetical protein